MKKIRIPMPLRYAINLILTAAVWALMFFLIKKGVITNYWSGILISIGINIILAVSLNVATGYLGQLPLGHAGFMAVGAYVGALFWKGMVNTLPGGANMIVGILLGGIAAGVVGLLIGIPALRLKGDYLAILTLGFGEIIRIVIINLAQFTGGTAGLKNIPRYSNFTVVYVFVILTCFFIHTMMKSRHGRAILSIRENEIAAESCGINTTYYKVMAFAVSAFFAGIAGALFAGIQGSLFPAAFGFMDSINVLVMVVLGGMGSMLGSVVAATVLTALPALMQFLSNYRMIIYALLLVVVMIFKPSGLFATYDFSLSHVLEKVLNIGYGKEKKEAEGQ